MSYHDFKLLDDESLELIAHDSESETQALQARCLWVSRACSALVGFSIGVFVQLSSLALNFLLLLVGDGKPVDATTYGIVTCAWSFLSSILGITVLLLMRSLVATTFYSTKQTTDLAVLEKLEEFMAKVIRIIEAFFHLGIVSGVGAAWAVTDLLVEIPHPNHFLQSAFVLLALALWYALAPKQ